MCIRDSLCLDHDAAGIEAVGRLSDVLREHGYSQIAPLQSEYKDWDEDLKARHGLEAVSYTHLIQCDQVVPAGSGSGQ